MNKSNSLKLALAVALLGAASCMLARSLRRDSGVVEQTFFYDLSEKKLFAVSREALPPIRGLNDAQEDAVRAVVISISGNPKDKASRKIAYLEKYAPELKERLEKVREGKAEPLPRGARDSYRFVPSGIPSLRPKEKRFWGNGMSQERMVSIRSFVRHEVVSEIQ